MNSKVKEKILALTKQFDAISKERRAVLDTLRSAIAESIEKNQTANLLYVCTHNSRRSHFGQVAGTLAAAYFGFDTVHCFSAGTEITAMNSNAVNALVDFGFSVLSNDDGDNPVYTFKTDAVPQIQCFSKRFDDASIPKGNVIAIMTCTDAEQNCPFIPGAVRRISLPYNDPKQSDGSGKEQEVYAERFEQILTEALYVFSGIKN
ncbi:MAG: protein-tyrosine-phosphatase [Chitinophagaceae bacterium]